MGKKLYITKTERNVINLKTIRIIIPIIILILSVLAYTTKHFLIPYLLIGFGITSVFDAVNFYKQNKKVSGIIILLSGLPLFIIAILFFLKY